MQNPQLESKKPDFSSHKKGLSICKGVLDRGRGRRRHGSLGEETLLDLSDHLGPRDHRGHDVLVELVGREPDRTRRHAARLGLEVENIISVLYILRAARKRTYRVVRFSFSVVLCDRHILIQNL